MFGRIKHAIPSLSHFLSARSKPKSPLSFSSYSYPREMSTQVFPSNPGSNETRIEGNMPTGMSRLGTNVQHNKSLGSETAETPESKVIQVVKEKWLWDKPPAGFYKVNVIITRMGDRFIVACIIRDENGMLVDPLGHIVEFPYKEENVCLVAFQAMQAGVAYFLKRVPGKTKLIVECDNRNAVSMYEELRPAIPVKFRETYWRIADLSDQLEELKAHWVPQEVNQLAAVYSSQRKNGLEMDQIIHDENWKTICESNMKGEAVETKTKFVYPGPEWDMKKAIQKMREKYAKLEANAKDPERKAKYSQHYAPST
ncbi:uncharacterized protein LOC113772377 [Coffea eugenioides]|uniref:uncharacterized protein LOC113772377 n=1 Tax=Coffea eugenioides TaxID=49369 RepID=UPI000F60A8D0|nr:uncharacterized protein LOC113772377 [Coffea eugenioides]